jgi:hypothetical protein
MSEFDGFIELHSPIVEGEYKRGNLKLTSQEGEEHTVGGIEDKWILWKVKRAPPLLAEKEEELIGMKEMVNHPEHYQSKNGMEVIDVIESYELNFNLGNAVKYILRSGKKGKKSEDLMKAVWYLQRQISKEERDKVDGD